MRERENFPSLSHRTRTVSLPCRHTPDRGADSFLAWDLQQIADLVREQFPDKADRIALGTPGTYGFNEPGVYVLDCSKSVKELGVVCEWFHLFCLARFSRPMVLVQYRNQWYILYWYSIDHFDTRYTRYCTVQVRAGRSRARAHWHRPPD
jgi:hypothetical protein